jgi:hypothetical protein
MHRMRAFSGEGALTRPVRLHGIQLGRPVDVLVERDSWRVLGFDVLCGDDVHRFLPFAASGIRDDEIQLRSALMLLDDIGFYRSRAQSLRELRGAPVTLAGRQAGNLRDLVIDAAGAVTEVVVERDGAERLVPADAALAVEDPSSASAA